MSDSAALRMAINGAWQAINTQINWNGLTFTYGQLLVLILAIVIVGLIVHFFT